MPSLGPLLPEFLVGEGMWAGGTSTGLVWMVWVASGEESVPAGCAMDVDGRLPCIVVVTDAVKAETGILTPGGPCGAPAKKQRSRLGTAVVAQGCLTNQEEKLDTFRRANSS